MTDNVAFRLTREWKEAVKSIEQAATVRARTVLLTPALHVLYALSSVEARAHAAAQVAAADTIDPAHPSSEARCIELELHFIRTYADVLLDLWKERA